MQEKGIASIKLYHQVQRVFNELETLGLGPGDPIKVEQLTPFDQYHYLGTEAVDEATRGLDIVESMRVLEVGGGIGGPARHLAHTTGCHMTVMELQLELNDTARELTRRCGLAEKIDHVCGDILKGPPGDAQFDALVSWLTFLHIPQRETLYAQCYKALAPGA
ncbi:MAG: SAM-dependent methyltransferase, partial [Gammaproteobacteria bacterium]